MTEKNQDQKQKPDAPKNPKFNYYWIYGLILLSIVAIQFLPMFGNKVKEITWTQFEQQMLKSHDVEKLVVVRGEYVQIFIKMDALENNKYEEVAENTFGAKNKGPHYRFNIGSLEVFEKNLKEAQANLQDHEVIPLHFDRSKNWLTESMGFIIPIAIIVIIWFIIMRRVSGILRECPSVSKAHQSNRYVRRCRRA